MTEGKPYRGTRGGAKSRKKKFFERQDLVRKLLHDLAARWGFEYQLPRVEYNLDDPTVTAIEDVEWELVNALDSVVIHVLAITVPDLRRLLDRLEFSVDKKQKLAPGDGPPSPRPWQVRGAAGGPPNPLNPNAPTHEDWDAVRNDPALAARLAAYDPSDDEPQAAGAAARTDVVDLDPMVRKSQINSRRRTRHHRNRSSRFWHQNPFWRQRQSWIKGRTTFAWKTRRLFDTVLLLEQGEEVQPEEREPSCEGEGAAEGAPGEVIRELILGEAAEQSSPEEELLDNHPLIDTEPDWDQDGAEATVQEEEAVVQNSPPERSRSRDSVRSRSRERVKINGLRAVKAGLGPSTGVGSAVKTPAPLAIPPSDTTEPECGNSLRLSSLGVQPEAHYLQGLGPLQQRLRQSHCQSARAHRRLR